MMIPLVCSYLFILIALSTHSSPKATRLSDLWKLKMLTQILSVRVRSHVCDCSGWLGAMHQARSSFRMVQGFGGIVVQIELSFLLYGLTIMAWCVWLVTDDGFTTGPKHCTLFINWFSKTVPRCDGWDGLGAFHYFSPGCIICDA